MMPLPSSVLIWQLLISYLIIFNSFRPSVDLEKYLESMVQLQKATKYFTDNHPESPEMAQVVSAIIFRSDLCEVQNLI